MIQVYVNQLKRGRRERRGTKGGERGEEEGKDEERRRWVGG